MKRLAWLLLFLLCLPVHAQTLSDNFQGGLNPAVWDYGTPSSTGGQVATFTPQNVIGDAAGLRLVAIRDAAGNITSGKIESVEAFRFGRFSFVAKLPAGKGYWPGLWLRTPEGTMLAPHPLRGEIDACEGFGDRTHTFQATLHQDDPALPLGQVMCRLTSPIDLSQGYHVYAVEWREDHVTWLLDGVPYCTFRRDQGFAIPAVPMRIVLSLNVGGSFDGGIDSTTPFPASLDVQSVSVTP